MNDGIKKNRNRYTFNSMIVCTVCIKNNVSIVLLESMGPSIKLKNQFCNFSFQIDLISGFFLVFLAYLPFGTHNFNGSRSL